MTDRSPIVHASVYINNTSIGTISDTNGTFILKTSYQGRIDLVISHVAFQKKVISLNPGRDQHRLMISLELKNNTLKEAVIKGDAVQGSIKWHALFMEYFIGTSHFAKKMCNKKP